MGSEQKSTDEVVTEARREWQMPEIMSVVPVSETRGNGGAGFDFGSEVSA